MIKIKIINWLKNKFSTRKYYYVSYLAESENGFSFGRTTVTQAHGEFEPYIFEKVMKEEYDFKTCVPIRVQEISKKESEKFDMK